MFFIFTKFPNNLSLLIFIKANEEEDPFISHKHFALNVV